MLVLSVSVAAAQSATADPIVVRDCRVKVVNEVSLSCERSGLLESIARQGATVKRGDAIAQLKDESARSAFKIAQREAANDIEIRFARKAGELAQVKYERARQAEQTVPGTITDFELRELRLSAERALLQLQQAQHRFALANLRMEEQAEQLNAYKVVAPFAGLVRAANKQAGEYVQEGEVVLQVVNDHEIRVDGYVDVVDLPHVAVGCDVAMYLVGEGHSQQVFHGQITFVDSKIEPVSMKARVSAEVANADSILKDGLLATMAIAQANTPPLR